MDLENYTHKYPNFLEWKQIERGNHFIEVSKIIGSSKNVSKNYNPDFSPKEHENNIRYQRVTRFIKEQIDRHKRGTLDLGFIHVFKFRTSNGDVEYFVGADGNRRVSNCKKLGVKKIKVDITEVIRPKN